MKQECVSTATIPMKEFLELKEFYEEMINNNKVGFYNGYHYTNDYTSLRYATYTFVTKEDAIKKIENFNTRLKEEAEDLRKEVKLLRNELKLTQQFIPVKKEPTPEKPKNIFSRLFKK